MSVGLNFIPEPIRAEVQKRLLTLECMLDDVFCILEDVGAFVAGGAITSILTGQEINDFDIYLPNRDALEEIIGYMSHDFVGYLPVSHVSRKAITFKIPSEDQSVQIVVDRFYETAEDIFDSFDFTVNMGAYNLKTKELFLHDSALLHASRREIHVNPKTSYPIVSLRRLFKYKDKGYFVQQSEIIKLCLAVANSGINDWDSAIHQIGGMYGVEDKDLFNTDVEFSFEELYKQIEEKSSIYSTSRDDNRFVFKGWADIRERFGFEKVGTLDYKSYTDLLEGIGR